MAEIVPLYFRDPQSAFQFACECLATELVEGAILPALVLDATAVAGTTVAVKRHTDGTQAALLRVSSADGGFMVPALTAGRNGPSLKPGDLIAWRVGPAVDCVAPLNGDKRGARMGTILSRLKPEYTPGQGWAVEQRFEGSSELGVSVSGPDCGPLSSF